MQGILERLKQAGMTGNEAKIYLELLKRGEANGNLLAKKTGLDRSLTYTVLNNLVNKGMVNYIMKDKKRVFHPTEPKNLLIPVKEKEGFIKDLLPSLETIKKIPAQKNIFTIYEGKEGLKVLVEKWLGSKRGLIFFGGTGKSMDILKWEMPHIIKRFVKSKVPLRGIVSYRNRHHPFTLVQGADIRSLKNVNSNATTCVVDDMVSIHVLTDKPIIMLMENKEIADGYRAYFDYMFKHADKPEKL